MKQNIIDEKKYSKVCENCFYGRMPKDNEAVLCEKKGVVDPQGSCRHYKYDPLKRRPGRISLDKSFTKEDFEL